MEPLWPYVGGKRRLLAQISVWLRYYEERLACEYREVCVGGGAVFLRRVRPGQQVWINDLNTGVACLWTSLIHYPRELCAYVRHVAPSREEFDGYKKWMKSREQVPDGPQDAVVEHGWKKLALQFWSWSAMAENSTYSPAIVKEKWRPETICRRIWNIHRGLQRVTFHHGICTAYHYSVMLKDENPAYYYIDPPYWGSLGRSNYYLFNFTKSDHENLARCLRRMRNPWLLSYDAVPPIIKLYRHWAYMVSMELAGGYSVNASRRVRRRAVELLIMPPKLALKA
jgi:DNA adenine methylase